MGVILIKGMESFDFGGKKLIFSTGFSGQWTHSLPYGDSTREALHYL